MSETSQLVINIITLVVAGFGGAYSYDRWIVPKIRKGSFDKNNTNILNGKRKRFLAEELGIDTQRILTTNTQINTAGISDWSIVIPIDDHMLKEGKPSIKFLESIISLGIKRDIQRELQQRGIEEDLTNEIAIIEAEKFIETLLGTQVLQNAESAEELKASARTGSSTIKRQLVKRNYETFKRQIKSKARVQEIKREYQRKVISKISFPDDISTVLEKIKETKTVIEEIEKSKKTGRYSFKKKTQKNLRALRRARVVGENNLIKTLLAKNETGRAEQIYTVILLLPGNYLTQLFEKTNIPYSTLSRYTILMEEMGLVTSDVLPKQSYRKEIYPLYSQEEIIQAGSLFDEMEICLKGLINKQNDNMYLDRYEDITIDIPKEYANKHVCIKGNISYQKKKIVVKNTKINEITDEKQKYLAEYHSK